MLPELQLLIGFEVEEARELVVQPVDVVRDVARHSGDQAVGLAYPHDCLEQNHENVRA